jgi:hypothetical protein
MFVYRLAGMQGAQVFPRLIKGGQQVCIPDLEPEEISEIVKQHARYGMVPAKELSRRRDVAKLCYSTDGPINVDQMLATYEINDDKLDDQASERRTATVAAMSDNIGKELGKTFGTHDTLPPTRLEVEVAEDTTGSKSVASGIEVLADPSRTQPRRARAS